MKHSTKICIALAFALIVIGGSVFFGALKSGNWELGTLSKGNLETRTWDIDEDFRDISIDSDTADIRFALSDNDSCHVVICESKKQPHTVAAENGTLRIRTTENKDWLENITLFSVGTPSITVCLPRTEYAALTIAEHTGDVVLPADFRFENIDIKASTGDVSSSASASGLIRVNLSTGDIRMDHISAETLDLTVSTGRIEVESAACSGEVGIVVSTGKAVLTDTKCGSLQSVGSTGSMTLRNVIAEDRISVERSTGDVKLENCDAAELSIRTTTGDVSGTLLSEKIFLTKTDTGDIEVPRTTSGGVCEITTDTGDIEITVK